MKINWTPGLMLAVGGGIVGIYLIWRTSSAVRSIFEPQPETGKSPWETAQDTTAAWLVEEALGGRKKELIEARETGLAHMQADAARLEKVVEIIRGEPLAQAKEWLKAMQSGDLRLAAEYQEDFARAGLNPREILIKAGFRFGYELTTVSAEY